MSKKTNIPTLESLIESVFIALKKLGKSSSNTEIDKTVIQIMALPKDITLIPHGKSKKETALQYRLRWARTYLKNVNILNNNSRGKWSIADEYLEHTSISGKEVVKKVRQLGRGITIKQIKIASLVERIEIQYFRSIYRTTIKNIHQINVFTGKNDVGKSNILKALSFLTIVLLLQEIIVFLTTTI